MEPTKEISGNAESTMGPKFPWQFWKIPTLFGVGLCTLQILTAFVRFGGWEAWTPAMLFEMPAMLFGLALFFLCGVLVGLLVQRFLRGSTGAWRVTLIICVVLATPLAVLFSLVGGLLGPHVVLIGTLVPYLFFVGVPVLIRTFRLRFANPPCAKEGDL